MMKKSITIGGILIVIIFIPFFFSIVKGNNDSVVCERAMNVLRDAGAERIYSAYIFEKSLDVRYLGDRDDCRIVVHWKDRHGSRCTSFFVLGKNRLVSLSLTLMYGR